MARREKRARTESAPEPLHRAGDDELLIISDSESDSDLYYATEFLVGDPVVYLETGGRKHLLVNDLEYGRARRSARVDEIVSSTEYEDRVRKSGAKPRLAAIAELYLQDLDVRHVRVPQSFPLGYAEYLRAQGCELELASEPLFPGRVVKTAREIAAIASSQEVAEEAMDFVVEALRSAKIRGGILYRNGEALTSEWLRRETHQLLLARDHVATNTIIAGGDQACDPHERGRGPLPANSPIIIDIFPRSTTTRYWGDMTRTVVRGKASAAAKEIYRAVLAATDEAIAAVRDGADGSAIHEGVVERFKSAGHLTEERNGHKVGFIHSTGHGVGLDIHESPRIGKTASKLEEGHVVTVEPGLYYPGVGGVRIEDLVVVTAEGSRNLNRFPRELEV